MLSTGEMRKAEEVRKGDREKQVGEEGRGRVKRDESVQCAATGSVYKRTELLSVTVLYTVTPLWGYTHISMDGRVSDYQAI